MINKHSKLKRRTAFYYCALLLAMVIMLIVNHFMNIANFKKMYKDYYFEYFDFFFRNIDDEIESLSESIDFVADDTFLLLLKAHDDAEISDADIVDTIKHMNLLCDKSKYLDSLAIINRSAGFAISTNGKNEIDNYFNDICKYSDYDSAYWKNYRSLVGNISKLPPTSVIENNKQKYIMPIVFYSVENAATNSIVIMNIDISHMLDERDIHKFTPNTSMYFVNKMTKQMYSADGSHSEFFDEESSIWKELVHSEYISLNYTSKNGSKYIVLSHTATPHLLDYAYVVMVPLSDINRVVNTNSMRIVIIMIILLGITCLLSVVFVNKLHNPFDAIIAAINVNLGVDTAANISDMTTNIKEAIGSLAGENVQLKNELSNAKTAVTERKILDIIENGNVTQNGKTPIFRYNNFTAIAVKIINNKNSDGFENREYKIFCMDIFDVIYGYFGKKFDVYRLPTTENSFQFLLNIQEEITKSDIEAEINYIRKTLDKYNDRISIKIDAGGIYPETEGIKLTYAEARRKVSSFIIDDIAELALQNLDSHKYYFTIDDENIIINNIIAGNYESARLHIEKIMTVNVKNDVTPKNMREMYVNIIHSMFMAFYVKKLDISPLLNGMSEATAYNRILDMTDEEICGFILTLFELLEKNKEENNATLFSVNAVIKYLEENYSDQDLCLDMLEDKFGVSGKYISKQFKKKTNVQLHKYLTDIKIRHAKEILENTDLNIEKIGEMVGYSSRSTFMRVFHMSVGITPSEYRKNAKENKK